MSKPSKKDEAFEIIELATNNLEDLAKAFELIDEVCTSFSQPELELSEQTELPVIH